MGTRYITEVILDGKAMVKQYGQWDGYPTYAGQNMCNFVKNADLSEFKNHLRGNVAFMPKLSEIDSKALNNRLNMIHRSVTEYTDGFPSEKRYFNKDGFPLTYRGSLELMSKGKLNVERR